MRTIKIDTECNTWDLYPDEWKGYIYAPEDEFDDVFVVVGNRDFDNITDAQWYRAALEYIKENGLPETEIMSVLNKLYPNDEFDRFDITGYVQREYQTVIYKVNGSNFSDDFKEVFGDFYFGHVTEIIDTQENAHEYVADSEFWKHEDNDLEAFIRDLMYIDDDEEIEILKSNGYTTVKNWVAI